MTEQATMSDTQRAETEIGRQVDYLVRLAEGRQGQFERARVEGIVLTNAIYDYLTSLGKAPEDYSDEERALNEARNRFLQHDAGNFGA